MRGLMASVGQHADPIETARGIGRREFMTRIIAAPLVFSAAFRVRAPRLAFDPGQNPPITSPNSPFNRAFNFADLKTWITPNSDFFVRSHFGVPSADPARWTVTVSGAVERQISLSMDELLKLSSQDAVVTLECAGNLVGWGGVSNARWAGASLRALLMHAGIKEGAQEVVLIGADGGAEREAGGMQIDSFARGIPLAKALDPATLLAYRMNGEPLPAEHGGPVRAVVPGWYGMDSVKWLKQVVVSRERFEGFYQTRRYYERRLDGPVAKGGPLHPMRVKSQIARPLGDDVVVYRPVHVLGAAWAGEAEIARVTVSFDGGRNWVDAELAPERAPYAWRLWSYNWNPAAEGRYEIVARARDSAGNEQPLERDPRIITPYANNWADRRTIEVQR